MVVGFAGLVIVAVPGGGGTGAVLSLTAALAVTVGTLLVRRLHSSDVVVVSAVHLGVGAAILAVPALIWEGPADISWTPRFLVVLGYLGVIATAATTMAWFIEVQHIPWAGDRLDAAGARRRHRPRRAGARRTAHRLDRRRSRHRIGQPGPSH